MRGSFRIAVGGYTDALTVLSFDAAQRKLVPASALPSTNASWLVPHPSAPGVWFTTSEVDPGFVRVLHFPDGALEGAVLGEVATGGVHPTHIALTPDGAELFVANYSSGDVSVLPVLSDPPYLAPPSQPLIKCAYTAPAPGEPQAAFNPGRQEGAHPHQVLPLADGSEVLVPDLGSDKVWRLRKEEDGKWAVGGFIPFARGSGPRHALVLGGVLYTLCELSLQLTAHSLPDGRFLASLPTLDQDTQPKKTGVLLPSEIAFASSLPPTPAPEEPDAANRDLAQHIEPAHAEQVHEPPPPPIAAEILAPPPMPEDNGAQYIYVSNRNEPGPEGDSIAIFTPLPNFTLVRRIHTGVAHLRGLNFSPGPEATYLALAGQNDGGVKIYERLPGGDLRAVEGAIVGEGEGGVRKPTSVTWL